MSFSRPSYEEKQFLIERFSDIQYAECTMSKEGVMRHWVLYKSESEKVEDSGYEASDDTMDSCTIVGAEFVHKLVKCGLFHPQSIGFFLEKQDSNNNSCKPDIFGVKSSEATDVNLSFDVELLPEAFYIDWLVFDNWSQLISILLGACPRLQRIKLEAGFHPSARCFLVAGDGLRLFADSMCFLAGRIQNGLLMNMGPRDGVMLEWLEVELFCRGISDVEFVKLGTMRHTHPLFKHTDGHGWNRQKRIVTDRAKREHWLTVGIAAADHDHHSQVEEEECSIDEEDADQNSPTTNSMIDDESTSSSWSSMVVDDNDDLFFDCEP